MRGLVERTDGGQMVTSSSDSWLEIATLPVSARPAVTKDLPIAVQWQSNNQTARISIGSDGLVSVGIVTNLAVFPSWAGFDGVEFAIGS
jgi:hypothetical protein